MLKQPAVAVRPSLSNVIGRHGSALFLSTHTLSSPFIDATLRRYLVLLCLFLPGSLLAQAEQALEERVQYIDIPVPNQTTPHNAKVFTQGLIVQGRDLWQSSGLYGRSFVERLDLASGRVIQKHYLPKQYFAEGIALLNNRLYLLSWRAGRVWVLDATSLNVRKEMRYHGEGWGLTSDGRSLVMSDGSDVIRYRNPDNFNVQREVKVTEDGKPVDNLNELEWIEGRLWANIWKTDDIVVINPETGHVVKRIDASRLRLQLPKNAGVLNGIAYDAGCHCLWLTGKNWPTMFLYHLEYGKLRR